MKNKIKFADILEFGTTPIAIFISISATLIFSICRNIFPETSSPFNFTGNALYISLSVTILQILLQNFYTRKDILSIENDLKDLNIQLNNTNAIIFPERKNHINNRIEELLNTHTVKHMKIICYGTGKYGRIIDSLISTYPNVTVDLIICSPKSTYISLSQSDQKDLEDVISELSQHSNIHLYTSSIPPTIRASVMYDTFDSPIWCSMQTYYLNKSNKMLRGEGVSPSIVAESNNEILLKKLEKTFMNEFDRLKKESREIKRQS